MLKCFCRGAINVQFVLRMAQEKRKKKKNMGSWSVLWRCLWVPQHFTGSLLIITYVVCMWKRWPNSSASRDAGGLKH